MNAAHLANNEYSDTTYLKASQDPSSKDPTRYLHTRLRQQSCSTANPQQFRAARNPDNFSPEDIPRPPLYSREQKSQLLQQSLILNQPNKRVYILHKGDKFGSKVFSPPSIAL